MLNDIVITRSSFDTFPFESQYSFFKTDSDRTLMAITLGIKTTSVQYAMRADGTEGPNVSIFGKLVDQTNPANEIPLSSDGVFAPAPGNDAAGIDDLLVYQALVPVPPGRYRGIFGAEDRVTQKVGTYRDVIVVPDLNTSAELTLSSILVAQRLDQPSSPPEGGADSPFLFGSLEVVQAANAVLKPSASLDFYYQIYNVRKDPETGEPRIEIDYDYYALQPEGEIHLGNIHLGPTKAQVQAYSLPLQQFPAADYILRIRVTDKVAGTETSKDLNFSVNP